MIESIFLGLRAKPVNIPPKPVFEQQARQQEIVT
jgi:hypothetical protein